MNHTVFTRSEFNESTNRNNSYNFTFNNHSRFRFKSKFFNHSLSDFSTFLIVRCNSYNTVVLDVDFSTGSINNRTDLFSARSDDCSDISNRNSHCRNAWCKRRKFFSRSCDNFSHFAQDVQSAFFSLEQSSTQSFIRNSFSLHIHLKSCDTSIITGNFEVHIAEEVLNTLNIS